MNYQRSPQALAVGEVTRRDLKMSKKDDKTKNNKFNKNNKNYSIKLLTEKQVFGIILFILGVVFMSSFGISIKNSYSICGLTLFLLGFYLWACD